MVRSVALCTLKEKTVAVLRVGDGEINSNEASDIALYVMSLVFPCETCWLYRVRSTTNNCMIVTVKTTTNDYHLTISDVVFYDMVKLN